MEEVEFLRTGTLLVTSSRIELDGQTFAVRNVASVKVTKPGRPTFTMLFAGIFALAALSSMIGGTWGAAFALALIAAAFGAYAWQQLSSRRLVLLSGGGEVVALTSRNTAAIEAVRAAIAQAISAR